MRPIVHLADRDDAIAFPAFYTFVSPALRAVARGPLRRARHAGRTCEGPAGERWCAECEATADDLLRQSFNRLRSALTGPVPTTRSGEPVREMTLVRDHLLSAAARDEDIATWAKALQGEGNDAEPAWLRAARAQLVHYPLRHLEEGTRRTDAVSRGASARPERDLRQAAWAAPLREDAAILDMLTLVVFRMRRRVSDPFQVPDDLRVRHGLTQAEAARRMGTALASLRAVNPGFFAANIDESAIGHGPEPAADPQQALLATQEAARARAVVANLLRTGADDPEPRATRRKTYQDVVAAMCALGNGRPADPVAVAAKGLGVAPDRAERLVRRLAVLVAAAGLEWTSELAGE
ncbi:hypothetical protein [Actinomadura roseirufa]|uniref:hypothetical protein n=1 Tax=Actinomadura roseirufa TaxID=2094049 RepID=UPI0010418067|nr:hypothetical protein [Actinomadura roseirufa]